jgi:hypothetical protein
MNYKSVQIGLTLEIEEGNARDYIDTIHEAFQNSGMDLPKHLGDALLDIETQLDADIKINGNKVQSKTHGLVTVRNVELDHGEEEGMVDGVELLDDKGETIGVIAGYELNEVTERHIDELINEYCY